jgi:hypothetical protein
MNKILLILLTIVQISVSAQSDINSKLFDNIPAVYSGISTSENGQIYFVSVKTGDTSWLNNNESLFTLDNFRPEMKGTNTGLFMDLSNKEFYGTLYYGLFPEKEAKFQQPVFFKKSSKIIAGKSEFNISSLTGKYDIAGWERRAKAKVGYRISDNYGKIIYDGVINIKGKGPFNVDLTIVAGPYISNVTDTSVIISFETNRACYPVAVVSNQNYYSDYNEGDKSKKHEIVVDDLMPDRAYSYAIKYGDNSISYSFTTAPEKGSRKSFSFAYTSDSRAGAGGGERNIFGVNAYIMKRMAVVASSQNVAFFQFTGDMINGYSSSIGQTLLELNNWKKAVEPYWHYIPFNIGPGNHEALVNVFNDGSNYGINIDKFPFNNSAEAIFSDSFSNPENGPVSEDGTYYDPHKNKLDFPLYGETVYYYVYDNIVMIVLNSNYWYAPSTRMIQEIGGNPHGYIMDNQMMWFENTIEKFDNDEDIDHIFVTIHTPAFPNGGHASDDMWYDGNNNIRPTVAGVNLNKGIIEQRDEFLNIMINKSDKVIALLCGDEHNYSRMKITSKTPIYPKGYRKNKIKISRSFWQITNGSAGAPYYGQQLLPWSESVEKFSTQYALMLFDIDGKVVKLRVINPDTMEDIETIQLSK